jgi:hypothetical protein
MSRRNEKNITTKTPRTQSFTKKRSVNLVHLGELGALVVRPFLLADEQCQPLGL